MNIDPSFMVISIHLQFKNIFKKYFKNSKNLHYSLQYFQKIIKILIHDYFWDYQMREQKGRCYRKSLMILLI
jgi:type IV secretory pathway VirB6-like protein